MGVRSFTEYGNGPLGFRGVYGRTESGACSALEAAIAPPRNEVERIVFLYIGNRGTSEKIGHQVIMLWMEKDNAPNLDDAADLKDLHKICRQTGAS
jgi:hypothetical protein